MAQHFDNPEANTDAQRRPSSKSALLMLAGGALCFALLMLFVLQVTGCQAGGGSGAAVTTEEAATAEKTDVAAEDETEAADDTSEADAAAAAKAEEEAKKKAEEEAKKKAEEEARAALSAKLTESITGVASQAGMQLGVCAIDLTTGAQAGYQGDQQMASASMIKIIVCATLLEQIEAGTMGLDDYCTLEWSDLAGGTGELIGRGAGAQVTYREIIEKTIAVSDNTGTNAIIRTVGMDAVNEEAKKLGLEQTELNRVMMDEAAVAAGIENYTSANDLAKLLKMIYDKTLVSASASEVLLGALEQQQDWGGIRNGLPADVVFAHKTGTLATVRHDGGIVESERPFVLVVLCGGDGFYEQGALEAQARVASTVYEVLSQEGAAS